MKIIIQGETRHFVISKVNYLSPDNLLKKILEGIMLVEKNDKPLTNK